MVYKWCQCIVQFLQVIYALAIDIFNRFLFSKCARGKCTWIRTREQRNGLSPEHARAMQFAAQTRASLLHLAGCKSENIFASDRPTQRDQVPSFVLLESSLPLPSSAFFFPFAWSIRSFAFTVHALPREAWLRSALSQSNVFWERPFGRSSCLRASASSTISAQRPS